MIAQHACVVHAHAPVVAGGTDGGATRPELEGGGVAGRIGTGVGDGSGGVWWVVTTCGLRDPPKGGGDPACNAHAHEVLSIMCQHAVLALLCVDGC